MQALTEFDAQRRLPPVLPWVWRVRSRVWPAWLLACLWTTHAAAAVKFEDSMAQRMLACTPCHGDQGRAAPDGYYPRIAGKPAGYLFNQLRNFREGRRHYALMASLVDTLSDAYLLEIARYFSALELPYGPPAATAAPAGQRGETLALKGDAALGIPACASCHGSALTGVAPHVPGLMGLPRDYLNAQLGAWKTGHRRAQSPDCMAQVVRRLGDDDAAAITLWLAAQALPGQPGPAVKAPQRAPGSIACGSAPELGGAAP